MARRKSSGQPQQRQEHRQSGGHASSGTEDGGRRTEAGAAAPWLRHADSQAVRHLDIQAAGRWTWTARRSSVL